MSKRWNVDKPFPREFRNVLLDEIEKARDDLRACDEDPDEVLHDLRKRCKRIRGLLRLVRDEIGDAYKDENRFFRDLARAFSDRRDRQVLVDTAEELDCAGEIVPVREGAPRLSEDEWREWRGEMIERLRGFHEERSESGRPAAFDEAERDLIEARDRLEDRIRSSDLPAFPEQGLHRVYKRGRKMLRKALEDPSTETLHNWRKRAKYLWQQLVFLENTWPEWMERHADLQHRLSDLLGDDHDLAVFLETLETHPELAVDETRLAVLRQRISRDRETLQSEALRLGRRLYAEKPKAFIRRLATYAEVARDGGK